MPATRAESAWHSPSRTRRARASRSTTSPRPTARCTRRRALAARSSRRWCAQGTAVSREIDLARARVAVVHAQDPAAPRLRRPAHDLALTAAGSDASPARPRSSPLETSQLVLSRTATRGTIRDDRPDRRTDAFEHHRVPLGIGEPAPAPLLDHRRSARRAGAQHAYELEIATDGGTETVVAASAEQVLVEWPVAPLASRERADGPRARRGDDGDWSRLEPRGRRRGRPAEPGRLVGPARRRRVGRGPRVRRPPPLARAPRVPRRRGARVAPACTRPRTACTRPRSTARGSATTRSRRAGPSTAKRLRYYTYDVTDLARAGRRTRSARGSATAGTAAGSAGAAGSATSSATTSRSSASSS